MEACHVTLQFSPIFMGENSSLPVLGTGLLHRDMLVDGSGA
jgi:hypothetical protein